MSLKKRGTIIILSSPSGAGKTTLMNVLSGLYRPDSGTISINNEEKLVRAEIKDFIQSLKNGIDFQTATLLF